MPIILFAAADGISSIETGDENKLLQTAGGLALIAFTAGWVIDFLGAPGKVIDARKELRVAPAISMDIRKDMFRASLAVNF